MPGEKRPEEERRESILKGAYRVATRETLGRLSMRLVAEEAGVSKGLVFFHFEDKEKLLLALLDWVLERGPRVEVPEEWDPPSEARPGSRLLWVVRHQVAALPERENRVELFLDFWVMGTTQPVIQERIRAGFARYRREFLPYTEPVAEAYPERFGSKGAEGLAAVAVSFIQGCALQLMADPAQFDVDTYMGALRGMVMVE